MMEFSQRDFRMLLLYEFLLDHKASEAVQNISRAIGKDLPRSTAYNWFKKFKDNNFELDDAGRSGRPHQVDNTDLKQLMEEDPGTSNKVLAQQLEFHRSTVVDIYMN